MLTAAPSWRDNKPSRSWLKRSAIVMPLSLLVGGLLKQLDGRRTGTQTPAADLMAPAPTGSAYLEVSRPSSKPRTTTWRGRKGCCRMG